MGKENGRRFKLRRRWWILGGVCLVCLLIVLFRATLLTAYANWFIKDNATKGADAVIILSGGKLTRVPKGLEIWKDGYAASLFLADEKSVAPKYQHLVISNLEFATKFVEGTETNATFGVIPSISDGATSTFDEAADALVFAKERQWERIIIVTDGFHTRRALLAFEKVFDQSGRGTSRSSIQRGI
ncbi:MAG: ElyC/SanA/YdcF family protein [Opitutales bacterium]